MNVWNCKLGSPILVNFENLESFDNQFMIDFNQRYQST